MKTASSHKAPPKFSINRNSDEYKKKVSDAAKRVEKRLAELHRSDGNEQSPKSNLVGNSADLNSGENYSPDNSGAQSVTQSAAKINKKLQSANSLVEKMADFVLDLPNRTDVTAENFAKVLVDELGLNPMQQSSEYIHYVSQDGDKVTLRKRPRRERPQHHSQWCKTDRGVSLVLWTENSPEAKFKPNSWAKVDEYVYKNPDKNRLTNIAKSIFGMFDGGEYVDLAQADEAYSSPRENKSNPTTGQAVGTESSKLSLSREEQERQTHTDNFKRWFGDWERDPENASKVVDKNGRPKVVLHGTPNKDFYAFDPDKAGSGTDAGWLGKGFYFFGNAPEYARQYAGKDGRVLEVYLDIKNPYYASVEEFNRLAEANDSELSRQFREQLEEEGYDGVYYNGDLNEEWVAFRPEQIKSATDNNGDFSRNNQHINFSLAGRLGAERLDKADGGTRIRDLHTAEQMERGGKDPRTIRLATGWERAADGQWRYELPDGDLTIPAAQLLQGSDHTTFHTLNEIWRDNELFNAYPQMRGVTVRVVNRPFGSNASAEVERWRETKEFNTAKQFSENYDSYLQKEQEKLSEYEKRLNEYQAEGKTELAEEMREVINNVRERINNAPSRKAWADGITANPDGIATRRLTLNKAHLSDENTRSAISHEIQHLIQEEEGFAQGGSPESAAEFVKGMSQKARIWEYKQLVEETAEQLGTYSPYEIWNHIRDNVLGIKSSHELYDFEHMGFIPDEQGRATAYNLFARGYDKEGYEEAYNQYYGKIRENQKASWWNGSPTELYRRLAGETEARNVQTRLDYTEDQRRNTTLADTEDIPRSQQIVRHENTSASEMSPVINVADRIHKGIDNLAKEISADRSDKPDDKLVVKLSRVKNEDREALVNAISEESNGSQEDLASRAESIKNMTPVHIDPKPITRKEFGDKIKSHTGDVIIKDDGMHVRFSSRSLEKIYNQVTSETGVANEAIKLLKSSLYAYSQPHNNTGLERKNGSVHPDRENALEYRNYVNKFTDEENTYYLRFTVMRTTEGDNISHGAYVSDVTISKEIAHGNTADDSETALRSAIPRTRRLSSVSELDFDAKLQNFFEYASTGRQKYSGDEYKLPLKVGKTTETSSNNDVPVLGNAVSDTHHINYSLPEARDQRLDPLRQRAASALHPEGRDNTPSISFSIADEVNNARPYGNAVIDNLLRERDERDERMRQLRDQLVSDIDTNTNAPLSADDARHLLQYLRGAMREQRDYDRDTTAAVANLAKAMQKAGVFNNLTDHEVSMTLTALKNATGQEDITRSVDNAPSNGWTKTYFLMNILCISNGISNFAFQT